MGGFHGEKPNQNPETTEITVKPKPLRISWRINLQVIWYGKEKVYCTLFHGLPLYNSIFEVVQEIIPKNSCELLSTKSLDKKPHLRLWNGQREVPRDRERSLGSHRAH